MNRSCAVQCYLDGRYEEACPLLEKCLLTKDEPAIRLLLGICQEKTGNLQAALTNYQKCRPLLYREGQPLPLDLDERLEKLSESQDGGTFRQALQGKVHIRKVILQSWWGCIFFFQIAGASLGLDEWLILLWNIDEGSF